MRSKHQCPMMAPSTIEESLKLEESIRALILTPQIDEILRIQKVIEQRDLNFFIKFPEYPEFRRVYVRGEFWPSPIPPPPMGHSWVVEVTRIDNVNRIRQLFAVKARDNWDANNVEVWPDEARHGIH